MFLILKEYDEDTKLATVMIHYPVEMVYSPFVRVIDCNVFLNMVERLKHFVEEYHVDKDMNDITLLDNDGEGIEDLPEIEDFIIADETLLLADAVSDRMLDM